MERTVLTISAANIITVNLMVIFGAIIIGLALSFMKGKSNA